MERERLERLTTVAAGQCNAVCFWFDLHLDEESSFSTGPEEETCWNQALFFFPGLALEVDAGTEIEIKVGHEPNRIWFDPPSVPGPGGAG